MLVIIGLLAGGILAGRDLIKAAEIRSQISQIGKFDLAVSTFKQRYGYLPGDISDINAQSFGLPIQNKPGNENAIIDDFNQYPIVASDRESYMFFIHLSSANLISDPIGKFLSTAYACGTSTANYSHYIGCQYPKAKIANGGFIATSLSNTKLAYFLGVTATEQTAAFNNHPITLISTGATITASDAFALDTKLDNGLPTTGKIKFAKYTYDYSDSYGCKSGSAYNITNTNLACNLLIESSGQ